MQKIICFAVLILTLGFTSQLWAQPDSKRADEDKVREDTFLLDQLRSLAYNQKLMKELEVSNDQLGEMKKAMNEHKNALRTGKAGEIGEKIRAIRKENSRDERLDALRNELSKESERILKGSIDKIQKIFLPHQFNRMRQVARQQYMRRMERADFFEIPLACAEEIELSPTKTKKLLEATEKARDEFFAEVQKLRNKKMEQILKSLSPQERAKLKKLVGDVYDFDTAEKQQYSNFRKSQRKAKQEHELKEQKRKQSLKK